MNKILVFIKKEFLQYKRNVFLIITTLILMPFIQLMMYSYTISYDVKNIPMIILNQDQNLISQNLCQKFQNTPLFNMKRFILNRNEIEHILKKEEAQIVLIIPEDFSANIRHNKRSSLQLVVDGTDSNTAYISLNNASSIIKYFSQELISHKKMRTPIHIIRSPSFGTLPQILYNPSQKSIIDMTPGIIATILLIQILATATNVFAKEKEKGTIKQLHLSNLSRQQYLIGKVIPVFIIGVAMFSFMLILAKIAFNMPLRGNIFILFISISIFLLSIISLSFCIVTFTKSHLQSILLQAFVFTLPFILFSGFLFPIQNMPPILQKLSFFNPLRHSLEILKGLTLKGSSLIHLRIQFTMLFAIATVFFTMGTLAFKRVFE